MFGKGKINIAIQRTNYAPGDIISGDVALTLKRPVKAREVNISLIGEHKTTQTTPRGGGTMGGGGTSMSTTTKTVRIYDFKQQLDGEKEYSEGREYRFEIKIPADILGIGPQTPEGALGQALKVAQTVATFTGAIPRRRLQWYLLAKLDIPGGLDISKKVDITIG
jgi:2',3'-cyclic-nucleotide 2'-phosphodiesterase (5'-nucleotidase family)